MSDDGGEDESQQDSKKFFVDRAKSGRATCKKCKEKLNSGDLRLAKSGYNPFGPGPMKMWHHVSCLFDVFSRQRPTTAKIETPDDIEGWSDLEEEDQEEILKYLPKCKGWKPTPKEPKDDTPKKTKVSSTKTSKEKEKEKDKDKDKEKEKDKDKDRDKEKKKDSGSSAKEGHKDDSFREFRRLCAALSETQSYTGKTALVKEFFTKGTDGSSFKGDLNLWCRLLLPGAIKRVYNLQSKQLIKLFSKILHTDQDDMLEDLEQGDVAETVRVFFEKSKHLSPTKKSNLSLQDVDKFLEELSGMTKEDEQSYHFKQMAKKCTSNDLKMIIRLVKHDLRINAGPKHILEAVHPDAYQAFQTSQDLDAVLAKAVVKTESGHSSPTKKTNIKITASVMTPVLPMLPKTNGDEGREKNETETNGNEHSDNKTKIAKKRSVSSDNDDSQTTKKPRIMKNGKSDSEEKESDPQKINSQETENDTKEEQEEDDEYTIFGNYVAHEIRSLTCEENKRELKRIIQKAIIDMGEMDDKKNVPDPQP